MLLWWLEAFISLDWLLQSLNAISNLFLKAISDMSLDSISDIAFSLLKIVGILLLLVFLILLARRVFQKEGLVIMPFDTTGDAQGKYNGKLISDLLTSELQRILNAHRHMFEGITIKAEKLSIPVIRPKAESLDYSIADMGTVGAGSATLSIGSFIVAFKRLYPGSEPVPILTGSLGSFGSMIKLAACLEERRTQAWEVSWRPKPGEAAGESIPGMIRELSFKIAFDMSKADSDEGISAKTWQGFMHFTEALEAYYNYTQTGRAGELRRSKKSCIKAVYSEEKYSKAIDMLIALGAVYAEKKDYLEAQKIFKIVGRFKGDWGFLGLGYVLALQNNNEDALAAFKKAIELNPQYLEAWYNKGVVLEKLNLPEEALAAFEKAIEIDPQYSDAWYGKGIALDELNLPEDALTAFEKAIEINPQFSEAWYNKGVALDELNLPEEALAAYEKAIEIDPQFSEAWYGKGSTLKKLHRNSEADEAFSRARELGFTGTET